MRPIALTILSLALVAASIAPAATTDAALINALDALAARVEAAPRDSALLTDHANLLVRAGRTDEALAGYRAALEVAPDSRVTLYNLGLLELELGHLRTAGRLLRRTVELDRNFARGHYALGMVLAERRQNLRAVQRYSTAFNLDPTLRDPQINPEVLFNDLATWASMQSYLTHSLERGTRLYNNPQPIVGLLIEGLESEPAAEPTPAEPTPAEPAPTEDPDATGDGTWR